MKRIIRSASTVRGSLTVPGDKSISHRALMLASLAAGTSTISNLSQGLDVGSTRSCLEQLGVSITDNGNDVLITGVGSAGLKKPETILDAGNSGTTMRLLAGILAAQPFTTILTGDKYLQKRPMQRIITPLSLMGAQIRSDETKAPLQIYGTSLQPRAYNSPIASGQVKSCVLLAGLFCTGQTTVTEPALSRDHTERMLTCFSADLLIDDFTVRINGPAHLQATDIRIPGDISSAAFLLAAAAILPGSQLTLEDIGINPTRTGVLAAMRRMGAKIELHNEQVYNNEPRADMTITGSPLHGITIEGKEIPTLIDELPILAIIATQAKGRTIIKDAGELKVKETDRIEAVAENLRRMGIHLETTPDGFIIDGPQKLQGAAINSHGDHRIAMGFAIAGLAAAGETEIHDSACAEISFPGFYDLLERITHE